MKKKLEADLMSIAHRILKLKNKDEVRELHRETQKLYEKLSVLLFVEENFEEAKPTISFHDIQNQIEKSFTNDVINEEVKEFKPEEVVITENKKVIIEEPEVVVPKTIVEEIKVEEIKTEQPKVAEKQIVVDDLLSNIMVVEPIFDRIDTANKETKIVPESNPKEEKKDADDFIKTATIEKPKFDLDFTDKKEPISLNLNDQLKKSINIGLNDRIAFEKNLFGGSSTDYNRVLSQLSTFDSLAEAKKFINEMVKPDYDNWVGKDEFADRFMEVVEAKFS
jgi:hypothetical protein